jgi:magnesium transporter
MMVVLAVFMPLVAGLGGNAGAQSIALIIRGLALGEVTFHNVKRVLYKQILVGLANGICVGIVVGAVAYYWKGMPVLGLVLGMAMILNIFAGTLIGTIIPLSLKWLKIDPALCSNMFTTGLTDAFGFLFFLGLATIFLKFLT